MKTMADGTILYDSIDEMQSKDNSGLSEEFIKSRDSVSGIGLRSLKPVADATSRRNDYATENILRAKHDREVRSGVRSKKYF